MSDLKPLVCPNCGGKINAARMKCEYCGTEFRRDDDGVLKIRYESIPYNTQVLGVSVNVPKDRMMYIDDDSAIRGFVMDEMTHRLAQALVPMMDITVQDNPHFNSVDVRGRIRIIRPDYRY
jgi:hypothetical protein